jgi:hypothetical protein
LRAKRCKTNRKSYYESFPASLFGRREGGAVVGKMGRMRVEEDIIQTHLWGGQGGSDNLAWREEEKGE